MIKKVKGIEEKFLLLLFQYTIYFFSIVFFVLYISDGEKSLISITMNIMSEFRGFENSFFFTMFFIFISKNFGIFFNFIFALYLVLKYKIFYQTLKEKNIDFLHINMLFLLAVFGFDLIFYLITMGTIYISNKSLTILFVSIGISSIIFAILMYWNIKNYRQCMFLKSSLSKKFQKQHQLNKLCFFKILSEIEKIYFTF